MAKQGQTQDPPEGQGQGDQGASQQPDPRVAQLEAQLQAATKKAQDEAARATKAEELARKRQSDFDALRARNLTQPSPAQQPQRGGLPGQPPVTPAQQRLQELENLASEQSRELLLMREMTARGLTAEDIEGIDFDTPTELRLALDTLVMRKEVEELRKSRKQAEDDNSGPEADTGGVSGSVGTNPLPEQAEQLYAKAKGLGRTREARWAALDAIHSDPSKIIQKG